MTVYLFASYSVHRSTVVSIMIVAVLLLVMFVTSGYQHHMMTLVGNVIQANLFLYIFLTVFVNANYS